MATRPTPSVFTKLGNAEALLPEGPPTQRKRPSFGMFLGWMGELSGPAMCELGSYYKLYYSDELGIRYTLAGGRARKKIDGVRFYTTRFGTHLFVRAPLFTKVSVEMGAGFNLHFFFPRGVEPPAEDIPQFGNVSRSAYIRVDIGSWFGVGVNGFVFEKFGDDAPDGFGFKKRGREGVGEIVLTIFGVPLKSIISKRRTRRRR